MSITAIVYKSNTGFTEQYAQMLGKDAKLKVYPLDGSGALPAGAQVLYMGPLMAGHIEGVDQAVKRFQVKAVCGVGMSAPGRQVLETLSKANYVPNAPIFYLQGGWAPEKVGWLKRRMVNLVTKGTRRALQAKSQRTPAEQADLDMLLHGGSRVAYENLDTLRRWLREQN